MRALFRRIAQMRELSFFVLSRGLLLACAMFASSLVLSVWAGPFSLATYELHHFADSMRLSGTLMLYIAAVGSVVLEDAMS
jgi:hypothetical protein